MDALTVPDNQDTRDRDILAEQQINRAAKDPQSFDTQRPVTQTPAEGSFFVGYGMEQPSPFLRGEFNTSDFSSSGLEDAVRGAVTSELKKLTINGQSPEPSAGGGLSFTVTPQLKASEQFALFNNLNVSQNPQYINSLSDSPSNTTQGSEPPKQTAPTPTPSSEGDPPSRNSGAKVESSDSTGGESAKVEAQARTTNTNLQTVKAMRDAPIKEQLKYFDTRRRMQGETREEFKARREEIRDLKKSGEFSNVIDAIKNGDTSYFYKGFIPLYCKRADGERSVLVRLDNSLCTVIKGAQSGERDGDLPAEDSYFLSGDIPTGDPYDLLAKITYSNPADPSSPSTDAQIGAIRHSDGDYDRGALSKVDDTSAKMQVWDGPSASSERYVGMAVTDTKSKLWGYGEEGDINFQALAQDGEGASLEVWDTSDSANAKYVKIKTDDFPANPSEPLFVKLREIEICEKDDNGNPYKILVLCSQKYSTQGG
jgi:hypothetical protein